MQLEPGPLPEADLSSRDQCVSQTAAGLQVRELRNGGVCQPLSFRLFRYAVSVREELTHTPSSSFLCAVYYFPIYIANERYSGSSDNFGPVVSL